MSDPLYAARLGDALSHTSMMADILGGVLEVAANAAITALAKDAVGAMAGVIVGVAMNKTGIGKGVSSLCEDIGNDLFPPTKLRFAYDAMGQLLCKHTAARVLEHRRAARKAASEIAGNLGSTPLTARKPDFRGGPRGWQTSKGRIGVGNQGKTSGWRDDELGHPEFDAGPHVNAWNNEKGIFDNLHLDY